MQPIRVDSKEGLANGWLDAGMGAGIGAARNLPETVRAKTSKAMQTDGAVTAEGPAAGLSDAATSDARAAAHGWLSATFRFVRSAIVGVLLLTTVPVAIVGWRSQYLRYYEHAISSERVLHVERLRPLMAPKDASITPMQAGLAFQALRPVESTVEFPTVTVGPLVEWPWRKQKATPDMFTNAGAASRAFNGPSPDHIVEIAPRGLSVNELAYLRTIAEAPVWENFDVVAAAPAVDRIGGQYQLPFKAGAFAPTMRSLPFASTKELAYASMSRAAYYLAIGEPARAELALKSTVSFGFAMIDNATTTMDALIGTVIVNIGRSGLEQFYLATHGTNDLVHDVPLVSTKKYDQLRMGQRVGAEQLRERLLRDVSDKNLPRGIRMEQLNQLSIASCRNIPEMILGPSAATRTAFDEAKQSLARFPSEQALLDLVLDETNRVPDKEVITNAPERFIMGAALIASTVTRNPRFGTCTRIALSYW